MFTAVETPRYFERDGKLFLEYEKVGQPPICLVFIAGRWVPYPDIVQVVHPNNAISTSQATELVKSLAGTINDEEAAALLTYSQVELRHVLRSQEFSREFLEAEFFPIVDRTRRLFLTSAGRDELGQLLHQRKMVTLFYEPSTRTRMSFELAARHLGMEVTTSENAAEFSSAIKGETAEDSIRIISSYHPHVIVVRHKEDGIMQRMARVSHVPIINGGEGTVQHPTQALLDVYTIFSEKGRLDDLTVVFGGDLKYGRTVRSGVYLLSKFKRIRFVFVSHEAFRIGEDLKQHLRERRVAFTETDSMQVAFREADVVYWTRTQKERIEKNPDLMADADKIIQQFTIGNQQMLWMNPGAILMHPLPRIQEIKPEVDRDPRSAYFRQAENGLYVRMALLQWVIQ